MNWREHPWAGVFPATLCAFHEDEGLDEEGLRGYFRELLAVPGVKGLVCNGHTGEVMSLRLAERARVTRILAEEASGFRVQGNRVQGSGGAELQPSPLALLSRPIVLSPHRPVSIVLPRPSSPLLNPEP